jgi:23S rRNA (guanosine2251-2'-O)-methyltransferase
MTNDVRNSEIILVLQNIRSAYNVGAMLRTADGVGVSKVYLCGYTPAPIDRFGRKRSDVAKAALGAEETVLWERVADIAELLQKLQKEGVQLVALEQDRQSVLYNTVPGVEKVALIVGEEVHGLSRDVLDVCDVIAEIPMFGAKESLNVSVATGIMLYQLRSSLNR